MGNDNIDKLVRHGLINYKDTNTKCRHLKNLTCKGSLRLVLLEFIDLSSGDTVSQ
jgi:hypothetical protein